jgi:predicted nucleic acid-binding protein
VILVDTSVWVDHFRRGNARLKVLLGDGEAATHPMVLGELACGNLPRRRETLHLLESLPAIAQAPDRVVREAIESRRLWGKGIGWIDAHLVVASLISGVPLWTLDRRLGRFIQAI